MFEVNFLTVIYNNTPKDDLSTVYQ